MRNRILLGLLISLALSTQANGENPIGLKLPAGTFMNGIEKNNCLIDKTISFHIKGAGDSWGKGYVTEPSIRSYIVEGIGSVAGGTVGGTVAGIIITIPLFILLFASEGSPHSSGSDFLLPALLFAGMGYGIAIGSASGTWLAGKLMKQDGSYRNAFRGSCIGVLIGGALLYGLMQVHMHISEETASKPIVQIASAAALIGVCLPVPVGSVIGYNHKGDTD